ncbi:sulfite exporter TauE/SafE family protein [Actinoalloteichus fjordicus]|uniref:Probable membrane transporter protein n=1 Tax=Actinoalloteichus fjordicus TaxID=1612552 RepID=A0AAC9PPR7_9PSEU|nr:sulfite exporter TauE/SafE family protein [Actinoalloteichus fjordicus]APU12349.1 putative permease [Actinoalloteichus fjordicus]APU18301.1 putative permease [Actinoalloteichus sp. GBA129-24]
MSQQNEETAAQPGLARWPILVVIGLIAGALSGLFGIGGGVAIVPALVAWCGRDQRYAVATSLLALGPLAVAGVIGYSAHGQVDLRIALPLAAGSMVGAWLGAFLLTKMPLAWLRWFFALIAVATALRMLIDPGVSTGVVSHEWWRLALLLPVGVLIGVIAALAGIGGGAVMVPVMQIGFGIPAALAKGTSLLVILPTSILGGWRNLRHGNGSLRDAMWIGCSGILATLATTQWSVVMNPLLSDVLFGLLLVFVAVRTVWQDIRRLLRRRG